MPRSKIELDPDQIDQVYRLASVLSRQQISDFLGIGRATFDEIWKRQPEVERAYHKGKAEAIEGVAKNLIQKANSGNMTAMIFFLKAQAGWRDDGKLTEAEKDQLPDGLEVVFVKKGKKRATED